VAWLRPGRWWGWVFLGGLAGLPGGLSMKRPGQAARVSQGEKSLEQQVSNLELYKIGLK
jgi:hypothetical protein